MQKNNSLFLLLVTVVVLFLVLFFIPFGNSNKQSSKPAGKLGYWEKKLLEDVKLVENENINVDEDQLSEFLENKNYTALFTTFKDYCARADVQTALDIQIPYDDLIIIVKENDPFVFEALQKEQEPILKNSSNYSYLELTYLNACISKIY